MIKVPSFPAHTHTDDDEPVTLLMKVPCFTTSLLFLDQYEFIVRVAVNAAFLHFPVGW